MVRRWHADPPLERGVLSLDDHDAASHEAMGHVHQHQRKFELAEMHINRAMSLNPKDVYIAVDRAIYRWGCGFSTSEDFNGDIVLVACFASSWTPAI
jgi:hypothetical protein